MLSTFIFKYQEKKKQFFERILLKFPSLGRYGLLLLLVSSLVVYGYFSLPISLLSLFSLHPYAWIMVFLLSWLPVSLYLERKRPSWTRWRIEEIAGEEFRLALFSPPPLGSFLLFWRSLLSFFLPLFYLLSLVLLRWSNLGKERVYWDFFAQTLNFLHSYPWVQPMLILGLYFLLLGRKKLSSLLRQESYSVYWSLLSHFYTLNPSMDNGWQTFSLGVNSWMRKHSLLSLLFSHLEEKPQTLLWLGSFFLLLEFLITRGSILYSLVLTFILSILYLLFSLYSFLFYVDRDALLSPELLLRGGDFPWEDAHLWIYRFQHILCWDVLKLGTLLFHVPRFQIYFPPWAYWYTPDHWSREEIIFFQKHG